MSINEILEKLRPYNWLILVWFCVLPVFAWLYGRVIRKGRGELKPHRYVYAVLVYVSCVPGMFAFVLTAYALLIARTNLLEVSAVLYFMPIVSMIATLSLIRKDVDTSRIPGFDRLKGLCLLLAVTFFILLMLMKTRLFLIFHAPMITLFVFMVVLFLLLRWASGRLLGRKQ